MPGFGIGVRAVDRRRALEITRGELLLAILEEPFGFGIFECGEIARGGSLGNQTRRRGLRELDVDAIAAQRDLPVGCARDVGDLPSCGREPRRQEQRVRFEDHAGRTAARRVARELFRDQPVEKRGRDESRGQTAENAQVIEREDERPTLVHVERCAENGARGRRETAGDRLLRRHFEIDADVIGEEPHADRTEAALGERRAQRRLEGAFRNREAEPAKLPPPVLQRGGTCRNLRGRDGAGHVDLEMIDSNTGKRRDAERRVGKNQAHARGFAVRRDRGEREAHRRRGLEQLARKLVLRQHGLHRQGLTIPCVLPHSDPTARRRIFR